jgi:hypothetical protein
MAIREVFLSNFKFLLTVDKTVAIDVLLDPLLKHLDMMSSVEGRLCVRMVELFL